MLLASENDLHRQDNIQKLAMRLHIAENSLLTLAAEQQRIEESRPPRRAYDEPPPDLPPLDYGDLDAPPDDEDSDYLDYSPVPRPAPPSRPKREVARWEADCLSGLLQDPDLLYQINRKLRELAGTDLTLLNGPLADFGVDDFSHSDYQILVQTFMVALDQDELAPLDYLREQLDDMLRQVLEEEILISDMDRLRPRLRHGLSADLAMVLKQAVMNDRRAELVRNALRLRQQRIEREREDLYFLMMEADHDQQMTLRERINLSIMAKRLIDDELQHQGKQVY